MWPSPAWILPVKHWTMSNTHAQGHAFLDLNAASAMVKSAKQMMVKAATAFPDLHAAGATVKNIKAECAGQSAQLQVSTLWCNDEDCQTNGVPGGHCAM